MNKLLTFSLFTMSLYAGTLQANSLNTNPCCWTYSAEVGLSFSYLNYRETVNGEFFVKDFGYFTGLNGSLSFHGPFMAEVDATYKFGKTHYRSNGTGDSDDGVSDHIAELRGLVGYDFFYNPRSRLSPYVGAGYRYLLDEENDVRTTTGQLGYDRTSNYYYSPIGIQWHHNGCGGWEYETSLEYDYFWQGFQISDFTHIGTLNDLVNKQNHGWGGRVNARFIRHLSNCHRSIVLEPYGQYWNINASDLDLAVYPDQSILGGREPHNNTYEVGVKVSMMWS